MKIMKMERRGARFMDHYSLDSDLNEMKFELMKEKILMEIQEEEALERKLLNFLRLCIETLTPN